MINEQDTLIINNKEVTTTSPEAHCLEMSWGIQTVRYQINIIVEKDSEADKKLREYRQNQDKYKVEFNIKKIEECE